MVRKLVTDEYSPDAFLASILVREELGQTNLNNILPAFPEIYDEDFVEN